ncbi:MAG: TIGR02588 family protein [Oscillatoriales cyanobacterium C42_A2020_001]|nr:TIGR02588 family protein [Leptolyngbyaceae cyanobacterium C42_A2020_001]
MKGNVSDRIESQNENQRLKRPPRSTAEWTTFGVASLVLGTITSLVVYSWATDGGRPPILTISRPEPVRSENNQFYVPFEIVNAGGETAESVQIIAELKRNREVEETADLQIDFLAENGKEKGAFVFTQNPENGELILRVGSYKIP